MSLAAKLFALLNWFSSSSINPATRGPTFSPCQISERLSVWTELIHLMKLATYVLARAAASGFRFTTRPKCPGSRTINSLSVMEISKPKWTQLEVQSTGSDIQSSPGNNKSLHKSSQPFISCNVPSISYMTKPMQSATQRFQMAWEAIFKFQGVPHILGEIGYFSLRKLKTQDSRRRWYHKRGFGGFQVPGLCQLALCAHFPWNRSGCRSTFRKATHNHKNYDEIQRTLRKLQKGDFQWLQCKSRTQFSWPSIDHYVHVRRGLSWNE